MSCLKLNNSKIQDFILFIKKNIYLKTNYKEARFYFDKIDINIDAYHKNNMESDTFLPQQGVSASLLYLAPSIYSQ